MDDTYNWYITFYWPSVEQGSIDIEKAGKVLIQTGKIFQKYIKSLSDEGKIPKLQEWNRIIIKTNAITNNCTTIQLFVEAILTSTPVETLTALQVGKALFNNLWLKDFFSQFMWTLWQQLALKVFSKWKKLEERQAIIDEKQW
jgi:hypothetical protein